MLEEKTKELGMHLTYLTEKELREMGKQDIDFEWNINFKQINLISTLELYDKNGVIFERIEETKFSKHIQSILQMVKDQITSDKYFRELRENEK